jgi:hypothetical protein
MPCMRMTAAGSMVPAPPWCDAPAAQQHTQPRKTQADPQRVRPRGGDQAAREHTSIIHRHPEHYQSNRKRWFANTRRRAACEAQADFNRYYSPTGMKL